MRRSGITNTDARIQVFNWETGEEDEPGRHKKEEELLPRVLCAPPGWRCVDVFGRGVCMMGGLVEGGGASVSVSLTCLIASPSSRLQTDAGAETWIRESHQRGGVQNEPC